MAVFGVDVAFAHHFVAPYHLLPLIGVLVVLAMPVKTKKYLKWWAVQLAIHSTIGA